MAKPFYEKAFFTSQSSKNTLQQPIINPDGSKKFVKLINNNEINTLLKTPALSRAFNKGKVLSRNEGFELDSNGINALNLHYGRMALSDDIERAIRQGDKNGARILTTLKKKYDALLFKEMPEYKVANSIFSEHSNIINAQELGKTFNKFKPEQLKRIVKGFDSNAEKEAFKIGVADTLKERALQTLDLGDASKKVFRNDYEAKQIKAIINNTTKFNSFKKAMLEERAIAETKFKLSGGSNTDINQLSDARLLSEVARGGAEFAMLFKYPIFAIRAIGGTIKRNYKGINDKNASLIARNLISKERSIKALENIVQKERSQKQKELMNIIIQDLKPQIIAGSIISTSTFTQ